MTSRREFLRTSSGAVAAFLGAPALHLPSSADADIIIRNGAVFDGLGSPSRELDVVISGGRIASLAGRATQRGTVEIDARGLAVAPGFIVIHSHGDGSLWDDPRAESLIRQGVTTIVVGQDGSSRAPRAARDEDSGHQFATFRELWASLEQLKPSVNVASMVGL